MDNLNPWLIADIFLAIFICIFVISAVLCIDYRQRKKEELRRRNLEQEELGRRNRELAQIQQRQNITLECGNALKMNDGSTIVASCSHLQEREEQRGRIVQQCNEIEELHGENTQLKDEIGASKEQLKAAWKMINESPNISESTLNQTIQCSICLANEKAIVFEPCMHLVACENCSEKLMGQNGGECPLCRGPIQKISRIYLA